MAAWDPDIACPARHPHDTSLGALTLLLDLAAGTRTSVNTTSAWPPCAPVDALAGSRPAEHVWHASARNAPGDRFLTDAEWA